MNRVRQQIFRGLAATACCALALPVPGVGQVVVDGRSVETVADGACWDDTNRYVDCGNGTVTDTVTGIIWLKETRCLTLPGVDPATGRADWPTAMAAAEALEDGLCGLTDGSEPGDWRLANFAEFEATMEQALMLGCTFPERALTNIPGTACDSVGPSAFLNLASEYWTSENVVGTGNDSWQASLTSGGSGSTPKGLLGGVWPVRTGR